ncbi:starch phosphorylase [Selaginella moellendorffii]|uniref:Alpha-1,4 glucan phosphorylase n=1 Tax=Selaginella moellendorffii TaxID=88036 RepID=D8SZZ5_SELML|nr:starch phosphorylase [Selaginella moellendorffii]
MNFVTAGCLAGEDAASIAANLKYHVDYKPLFYPLKFESKQAYYAAAQSVRDHLVKRWNETFVHFQKQHPKHIHYLSMEFLQGRALTNAIGNMGLTDSYAQALKKLGHDLEKVAIQEPDAALGNGGLGRLASCFLDSLATLNYPAWGYGLRYKYGLFRQQITNEGQQEWPESWLEAGNPWEIPRFDVWYPIKFFGRVISSKSGKKKWVGGEDIRAVAYDLPIPGYKTKNTISLRLWSTTVAAEDFDLVSFNAGEHDKAGRAIYSAERICNILYPGDATPEGKLLRLKQQYTLCSASIQDMIARFKERSGSGFSWSKFSSKVAIQMNDTHPTLCVPELMRILVDIEGLAWEEAWKITQATVAYTNHTVLPEALEKWPLDLMQKLLPRHIEIIHRIDEEFIKTLITSGIDKGEIEKKILSMRVFENVALPESVKSSVPHQHGKDDDEFNPAPELVRMANLCVIAGHKVNGVAAIHSEIVKDEVFNDFYKLWPEKFQNKTNGVTPRRWMRFCNPELSKVITKYLGSEEWVAKTDQLARLKDMVDNKELIKDWAAAKRACKSKLAAYIKEQTGLVISPDSLFDTQASGFIVKRIHEYKRQLLNILGCIYRYKKMKEMSPKERKAKYVNRVTLFGGKAFATYWNAKRIVKLITDVGNTVNKDPDIGDLMKVIIVPDYNVSVAEILIPGSELSEQISTAGMEASGTSNMKFSMNGAVLIGTLDGANVEIREEVGEDNFFLFGAFAHEVANLRKERAEGKFEPDPRFIEAMDFIKSGAFGGYDYTPLLSTLEGNSGFGQGDYFLVGKDFPDYIECQEKVDEAYRDKERWTKMSIMNVAGSPKFSSDRTIHEYANEIWGIKPLPVP